MVVAPKEATTSECDLFDFRGKRYRGTYHTTVSSCCTRLDLLPFLLPVGKLKAAFVQPSLPGEPRGPGVKVAFVPQVVRVLPDTYALLLLSHKNIYIVGGVQKVIFPVLLTPSNSVQLYYHARHRGRDFGVEAFAIQQSVVQAIVVADT